MDQYVVFPSNGGGGSGITSLTGEVTATGPGAAAATVSNAAVIAKVLTGFSAGAGTVAASDSILQAVNKIVGNLALKAPLAGPTFTGNVKMDNLAVGAGTVFNQAGMVWASANAGSGALFGTDASGLTKFGVYPGGTDFGFMAENTTDGAIWYYWHQKNIGFTGDNVLQGVDSTGATNAKSWTVRGGDAAGSGQGGVLTARGGTSASGQPGMFQQSGISGSTFQYATPATGDTVTVSGQSVLVVNPAAGLATLTIVLPASPRDGQRLRAGCSQVVTALTLSGSGGDTVKNALSALVAGGTFEYVYRLADTTWYRIG